MGRVKSDSDKTTSTLRQQAVDRAWEREVELVREGKGTRQWTPEEQKELLSTGKVEGYQGHHMQSVNTYPENAGNPDNIQFLTHDEHFNGAHNSSYYNQTNGYYDPQTKTMNEFKDNQIEPVQPVELEQSAWSTPEEREEAYKQGLVYRNDRDYDDKLAKYEKGLNERTDLTDEQKAERLSTMKEKYEAQKQEFRENILGKENSSEKEMNESAGSAKNENAGAAGSNVNATSDEAGAAPSGTTTGTSNESSSGTSNGASGGASNESSSGTSNGASGGASNESSSGSSNDSSGGSSGGSGNDEGMGL